MVNKCFSKNCTNQAITEFCPECLANGGFKPTLGIIPKYLWDEKRLADVIQAINRRIEAKQDIPTEWIEEYNELI